MENHLENTLNSFIARTGKSKVAVIIPMYGYWSNIQDNPLTVDTMRITLDRVQSSIHQLYIFIVGEPMRTPLDIGEEIVVRSHAGNVQGVAVDPNSPYAEYVREGLRVAQKETDAAYFIILNPWVLIQQIGLDMMVDRLNSADSAKLVCGYDLKKLIDTNDPHFAEMFDGYSPQIPREERYVDSNFMGLARYTLETHPFDPNYRTHKFLEFDMWQQLHTRGNEAIASQRIPIFVFDIQIDYFENPEDLELDKVYFTSKWGFLPQL